MSVVEDQIRFTPDPSCPLTVQDAACAGKHTIILSGEMDLVSGPVVAATVRRICAIPSTTQLTIDLRKLSFIDSTGIKALLEAKKLCTEYRHVLRVVPGPKSVQRILEITGLIAILPFVEAEPGDPASSVHR